MTDQEPQADTIHVDALGDPADTMEHDQLPPEPPRDAEDLAEPSQDHQLPLEALVVGLQAPFSIVAMRRGPHWRVDAEEVRPIAEALVQVLPATALTERLVAASPWASAGVQLYALVQVRLEADAALAAEKEPPTDAPLPRPRVVPDPRQAGAAVEPPGQELRREPGPDGTGDGGQPYTGEGLGLRSPGIGPRPAGPGE